MSELSNLNGCTLEEDGNFLKFFSRLSHILSAVSLSLQALSNSCMLYVLLKISMILSPKARAAMKVPLVVLCAR